ncbi:MAG: hypothetical protein ABI769_03680, partial [Pseudomonadota bacterium]
DTVEDLVAALVLDADGAQRISMGAPLITDDDNRIATSSVYEMGRGMNGETSGRLFAAQDPLQRGDSVVYGALKDTLSFPYLARRNGVFVALDPSLADRVGRMSQILADDARGEYLRSFYYRLKRQQQRADELLRLAIDAYPADESLRLEFLRGWFNELAIGSAPPEVTEVAVPLSGSAARVLELARHAAKEEWRDVAVADAELAAIPWTSVWYAESLELRVNWRIRVTDAKSRKRFGDEAISLIDRLAIMSPTLNLYALRTRAGFASERPEVVVESLANYARLASGLARGGVTTSESLLKDAKALAAILDDVAKLPTADAARVAEVRADIAALAVK